MEMAKASEADLNMAVELCEALEALTLRWDKTMPEKIAEPQDSGDVEYFYPENSDQCQRVVEYLITLMESASLSRVIVGMAVLLDPKNKIVDPDADTLERHPAMLADSERLRWLTTDHTDRAVSDERFKLLGTIGTMGYSDAAAAIDLAMRECAMVSEASPG